MADDSSGVAEAQHEIPRLYWRAVSERNRRSAGAKARVFVALLAVSTSCGPSDPLEKIRLLQDVSRDFQGSIEPLRALIEARPDDPEVHYRYGTALIATGEVGLALWPLKKAMESPEWVEKAGLPLATSLLSQGAYDDAIEVCGQVLERKPDDVAALLLRANARMHSRRDYEGSLADADRVLELEPDNIEALVPRAVALLALGRVDEAAVVLDDLDALFRDDSLGLRGSAGFCIARATFAKEKGDVALAEERYQECVEKFPTEGMALRGAIEFFDGIGRPERSNEILAKALELAPVSYSFRSALVLRLNAQGKVDEAEALLRQGTELESPADAADCWAGLASFNLDHGDFDEALAAFEKARELDRSGSPQLLLAHADALVIAGRFDDALALADRMELPAHRSLVRGRVELARGEPAAALKLFDEGMSLWPNNAVARYYAAIAAEQLGDFARAIEDYRYAMRIDAAATDAYLRQARLHVAAGRYDAALATLTFQPGGRPEEVAAGRLHVRVLARLGRAKQMPKYLLGLLARPEHWGAAVAALGEGVRERSGSPAALEVMRRAEHLDLEDPRYVDALAAIVEDLAATGKAKEGLALVDAGLLEHPDAAEFHAVHGRALSLSGAPAAPARAAFERALAIDAKSTRALVGLARLEAGAGAVESALALYERAVAEDPNERPAAREAAALLVALGRPADAEQRLIALLREHPYDAAAARSLAELRLARGADDERTLELARRAVAFGGGPDAEAFLERVSARARPSGADSAVGGETG